MNRLKQLVLLTFFFSFCFSKAQDRSSVTLELALKQISEHYEVNFNYAQKLIADIEVVTPNVALELTKTLTRINDQTGLLFTFLENNLISITRGDTYFVCGYIKDKDGLFVLEGATIHGAKNATTSDLEGYFELEVNNPSELILIRYLGYKTITRHNSSFKKGSCESIYLVSNQLQLSQIVLQGFLVKGIDKKDDGAIRINFNEFSILPGVIDADVLQVVQALPGISSINETVSNISIRGGTHDQSLILWDEIKMYQSGHFFGLISVFNPQMSQGVSVIKNGSSSHYTDGVSGTIAMTSSRQLTTQFKANLGLNLVNADAFLDIPLGIKSSLQVAGRKSISDFFITPTYDQYFDRISQDTELANNSSNAINSEQEFDFYDMSLRWLYQISDKDLLRLNFLVINNELLFTESDVVAQELESRQSSLKQNSIAAGLFYSHRWNQEWQSSLQGYNTDYKLEAINANVLQSQRFLQENSVSETGIKAQTSYQASTRVTANIGYQFLETKIRNLDDVDNPIFRSLIGEVVRSHGGFLAGIYKNTETKTRAELGGRYNYISKFNRHIIEPRLSFSQGFAQFFSLEVLGEFKHQTTSQIINFQNDFLGVEKRRWQLSNETTIPIIESKQGSVGVSYNQNSWLINIEGYFKQVDGITTQSQGFQNQFEFAKEVGSYSATGIEFLLRKNLWRLNFWSSYSYLDSTYNFETLSTTEFANNNRLTHTASFGTTYNHKALKVSLGLNYQSGRPTTLTDEQNPLTDGVINYATPNAAELDYYMRLDASVVYSIQLGKSKLQMAASVWNILDKENIINSYYTPNPDLSGVTLNNQRSLGITPNVAIRYFF